MPERRGESRGIDRRGAVKVFRETASGAKTERRELARSIKALKGGDTLPVTRLDRLARSTCDLLNTLARSLSARPLSNPCRRRADTTTATGV